MSQLLHNHLLMHNKWPYLSLTIFFFLLFSELCYCTSLLLWPFSCMIIKVSFALFSRKGLIYSPFWEQPWLSGRQLFFICYWNQLNLSKNGRVSGKKLQEGAEVRLNSSLSPSHTPAQTHPQSQLLSSCTQSLPPAPQPHTPTGL